MAFGPLPPPTWNDRDLIIVGGGLSLEGRDLSRLRERGRVLGINIAPEKTPCDACFSIDHHFMRECADKLQAWAAAGMEVMLAPGTSWFDNFQPIPGVDYIKRVQGVGISAGPGTVVNGLNSGYCGLCYGILRGARRIHLLGFDMNGPNQHWHGGYPWGSGRSAIYFPRWAARFNEIAQNLPPGVEVLNCNPESAITAFPFAQYSSVGI